MLLQQKTTSNAAQARAYTWASKYELFLSILNCEAFSFCQYCKSLYAMIQSAAERHFHMVAIIVDAII